MCNPTKNIIEKILGFDDSTQPTTVAKPFVLASSIAIESGKNGYFLVIYSIMKKYLSASLLVLCALLTGCSYLPMKNFDLPIGGSCPTQNIPLQPLHPGTNTQADLLNNPNINTYAASVQMCLGQ